LRKRKTHGVGGKERVGITRKEGTLSVARSVKSLKQSKKGSLVLYLGQGGGEEGWTSNSWERKGSEKEWTKKKSSPFYHPESLIGGIKEGVEIDLKRKGKERNGRGSHITGINLGNRVCQTDVKKSLELMGGEEGE